MKRLLLVFAVTYIICAFTVTGAFAFVIQTDGAGNAGKWEPGPDSALWFDPAAPPGTPGGATWSIMNSGIFITFGDLDNPATPELEGFHTLNDQSSAFGDLVAGVDEISVMNWAFDQWASVSGFTNLGQVADGGTYNGASNSDGGHLGDIRIGAYPFVLFDGDQVVTAHTMFFPATNNEMAFGSVGGDIHFNNDMNAAIPNQLEWVDNEFDVSGNGQYDFYTVALHEVGHALGLGHSDDPNSVMALYNVRGGALRTLTADDITGIQAIYGPGDSVPEPSTIILLGSGLLGLIGLRRRFRK